MMDPETPPVSETGTASTTGTPARTVRESHEDFLVSELDHHMTPAKPGGLLQPGHGMALKKEETNEVDRGTGVARRGSGEFQRSRGAPFSNVGIARYGMACFEPNKAALTCSLCPTEFGFFKRRHHCRACRRLVCDSCSDTKVRIGAKKGTKVRLCDRCCHVLKLPVHYDDVVDDDDGKDDYRSVTRSARGSSSASFLAEAAATAAHSSDVGAGVPSRVSAAPRTPARQESEILVENKLTEENEQLSSKLAEALEKCHRLEIAEQDAAARAENAAQQLEALTLAHKEEKMRWTLSPSNTEAENRNTVRGSHDSGPANTNEGKAEELLALEAKLQKAQESVGSLTLKNNELANQILVSLQTSTELKEQHEKEVSQLQFERERQRQQDRDDLLVAERELSDVENKLASALALASSTEEKRVAMEKQFEKQKAQEAKASAAAAEIMVAEALQKEEALASERLAQVRSEMKAAEEERVLEITLQLKEKHNEAVTDIERTASEALSEALSAAEKKRKEDLAAAQHGHQALMEFHLSQAVAAAAQKEVELRESHVAEHTKVVTALKDTHEETLKLERRKSVQSLTAAESRHTEAMERSKQKYRKRVDRAAREATDKAEKAERSRAKKKMKKLREKHRRNITETKRKERRRATAQRVSSLQARIIKNDYPASCFYCADPFTLFSRQHHCRGCGLAVCDSCSSNRVSRRNLRLSKEHWVEICRSDEKLESAVDNVWDIDEVNDLLPEDIRCCNACYSSRDMLRFEKADEEDDENLFDSDDNDVDDEVESSYAPSVRSSTTSRLSSLNEFF